MIQTTPVRKAKLLGRFLLELETIHSDLAAGEGNDVGKPGQFIRESFERFDCLKDVLDDIIHYAASQQNEIPKHPNYYPLYSIFKSINIGRGSPPDEISYYNPAPLNSEKIFPEESPLKGDPDFEKIRNLHREHWEQFRKELDALPSDLTFDSLFDTLYFLLEKWASKVTLSHDDSDADISVFNRARVETAWKDCLEESTDKDSPFLVIEGGMSGIQGFIYKIESPSEGDQKGTSKIFRGRSFFVSLLSESIADYFLKQLGLYRVHLVMEGGGHFHILAPNTEENRNQVEEMERTVNRWLLREYQGELGLVIAYKPFAEGVVERYSEVKKEMLRLLSEKKSKKNLNLFGEYNLFGPFEPVFDPHKEDFMELGAQLPKNKYLVKLYAEKAPKTLNVQLFSLKDIGIHWFLSNDVKEISGELANCSSATHIEITHLNEIHFAQPELLKIQSRFASQNCVLGIRLIGNYAPVKGKNDIVMTFDEISELGDGYPMLHVLRMDVDSLGKIFTSGISGERQSLSRVASLSRAMNLFFSGYINHLAKEHKVYITYAGGDDLFAVGKWNQVIYFAKAVWSDFRRYTCQNPNLSISGGAVLVRSGFPIRRAAELAGQREYLTKQSGKNALSLFDEVHRWERMDELVDWGAKLVELIDQDKSTQKYRSLLRYLKGLHDKYSVQEEGKDLNWIWKVRHKVFYMLARRAGITEAEPKHPKTEEEKLKYRVLGKLLHDYELLNHITVPANYAILQTRKPKTKHLNGGYNEQKS